MAEVKTEPKTEQKTKSMTEPLQLCEIKNNVVRDKISAILVCQFVPDTTTAKTGRSGEKYLATNELNPELLKYLKEGVKYVATGKIDGTCTYIANNTIYKR